MDVIKESIHVRITALITVDIPYVINHVGYVSRQFRSRIRNSMVPVEKG